MSDSTIFSKVEADRILRRAAEIEGSDDGRPISIGELRSIASEAGFGSRAVERALAEAHRASPPDARRSQVRRSGFVVTRLTTTRTIPFEISSEQLMRTVRLFQPYREGPAQVKLEEHQTTWRDRRGLGFTVVSTGGATEIRVSLSRVILLKGRWMGWVRAAADRLEALVLLVVTSDTPALGSGATGEPTTAEDREAERLN